MKPAMKQDLNHNLEACPHGYRCRVCGKTWRGKPQSACPGMPWYEPGQAPEHLLTRRQLRQRDLKPGGECLAVVGFLTTELYDLAEAVSISAADRQAERLARWEKNHPRCGICLESVPLKQYLVSKDCCKKCHREGLRKMREYRDALEEEARRELDLSIRESRDNAIQQARDWLALGENALILDTETTGLDVDQDEPVALAVIDLEGRVLFDTLLDPGREIPAEATRIHGIDRGRVAGTPSFADIHGRLSVLLQGRTVIVYNAEYDRSLLRSTCQRYGLAEIAAEWVCAMQAYARYYGEWSDHWGSFRWQKLNGGHTAVGDCLATLKLIREMASARKSAEMTGK